MPVDDASLHVLVEEAFEHLSSAGEVEFESFCRAHSRDPREVRFALERVAQQRRAQEDGAAPSRRFGPYELGEHLGTGAMGSVFRAMDAAGRVCVVKVMSPALLTNTSARLRFEREGLALARLDHPHLVRVRASGIEDEVLYLVMDWVPGPTLAVVLRVVRDARNDAARWRALLRHVGTARAALEQRAQNWRDFTLQTVRDLADGLQHAHAQGVVHRDLKPANVAFDEAWRPIALDLGLAQVEQSAELTLTGRMVGTVAYCAPEQREGGDLDGRADVYALGIIAGEMLTGRHPRGGVESLSQRLATGAGDHVRLPGVEPLLRRLLKRATDPTRARRLSSAAEFADQVEELRRASVSQWSARLWPWRFFPLVAAALAFAVFRVVPTAEPTLPVEVQARSAASSAEEEAVPTRESLTRALRQGEEEMRARLAEGRIKRRLVRTIIHIHPELTPPEGPERERLRLRILDVLANTNGLLARPEDPDIWWGPYLPDLAEFEGGVEGWLAQFATRCKVDGLDAHLALDLDTIAWSSQAAVIVDEGWRPDDRTTAELLELGELVTSGRPDALHLVVTTHSSSTGPEQRADSPRRGYWYGLSGDWLRPVKFESAAEAMFANSALNALGVSLAKLEAMPDVSPYPWGWHGGPHTNNVMHDGHNPRALTPHQILRLHEQLNGPAAVVVHDGPALTPLVALGAWRNRTHPLPGGAWKVVGRGSTVDLAEARLEVRLGVDDESGDGDQWQVLKSPEFVRGELVGLDYVLEKLPQSPAAVPTTGMQIRLRHPEAENEVIWTLNVSVKGS